jgi:hypothetical protein
MGVARVVCRLGVPCVLVGTRAVVGVVCGRHRREEGRRNQGAEACGDLPHGLAHQSQAAEAYGVLHPDEDHRTWAVREAYDDPRSDGMENEVHPCQVRDENRAYVPRLVVVLEDVREVACRDAVEEDICRWVGDDEESEVFLSVYDCTLVGPKYDSCRHGKVALGSEAS